MLRGHAHLQNLIALQAAEEVVQDHRVHREVEHRAGSNKWSMRHTADFTACSPVASIEPVQDDVRRTGEPAGSRVHVLHPQMVV